MRITGVFVVFVTLPMLAAGCFNPRITDGGFVCDPAQPQPCPEGYYCRELGGSFLCTTNVSAATGNPDLAMSSGGGGGGGGGGVGGGGGGGGNDQDMAMSVQDLAMPVQDMAKPADMVVVSSCAHDECTTGVKLTNGCSPCVTAVCMTGNDPSCCTSNTHGWDSICVSEVNQFCTTKTCP